MATKGKNFSAKLAHEISTHGKVICPQCNTEVKRVKLIRAAKSASSTWTPRYDFVSVCKCNEKDLASGKI